MDAATYKKVLNENGLVANSGHYRLGEEQEKGADVNGTICMTGKERLMTRQRSD